MATGHSEIYARICAALRQRHGSGGGEVPWERGDYLHAFGKLTDALLYAVLFAPEFVEVGGFVFLKELAPRLPGGFDEVSRGMERARVVSPERLKEYVDSFNWIEVPYLTIDRSSTDGEGALVAEIASRTWAALLQHQFPCRSFNVRVLTETETGGSIGIGFSQS